MAGAIQLKFVNISITIIINVQCVTGALLSVFRASGTVYTAIDIATGQEVGLLYHPPYFPTFYISLVFHSPSVYS